MSSVGNSNKGRLPGEGICIASCVATSRQGLISLEKRDIQWAGRKIYEKPILLK